MKGATVECEAKFLLPSPEAGRAAFEQLCMRAGRTRSARIRAMEELYLDTPDRLLLRGGLGLRIRRVDGVTRLTLKSAPPGPKGMARRFELEEDLPGKTLPRFPCPPPGRRIARTLRQWFPGMRVAPVLRLRKIRKEATWDTDGGCTIECAFDLVRLLDPGPSSGFAEMELERLAGNDDAFHDLARTVEAEFGLVHDGQSKLERALALAGILPPRRPGRKGRKLIPADSLSTAAAKHLGVQRDRLHWVEPGIRTGVDPAAVHQARIAVRRLRAALRLFRPAFTPAAHDALKDDLRWLTGELGRVRDLDVALERLRNDAASLPQPLDAASAAAAEGLERLRDKAQAHLRAVFTDLRYARLLALLDAAIAGVSDPARPPASRTPVARVAKERLAALTRRALRRTRALRKTPDDEALHDVRIACKNLRYAHQFFADIEGHKARKAAKRLRRFTDALGVHQDAILLVRGLRSPVWRRAVPPGPNRAATQAGLVTLATFHEERAERLRRQSLRAVKRWRATLD